MSILMRAFLVKIYRTGREQKAREGRWNGGFAPYGYKLENGELVIADDEVDIIKLIYDRYIHTDFGINGVASYLNNHGYTKKLRLNNTIAGFSSSFVKNVLDNPDHAHILSGILKCPCCGKSLYGNIAKAHSKDKKTRYYYYCKNTLGKTGHKCTFRLNIEQKKFMRAFIDRIDIYQDKPTNGCWIKNIVFNFPVPINGKDIRELSLENETMLETVCLLSKLHEAKHHINVKVDMDELDLTSAEAKTTYKEIEEWVQEHYGFHVTNLNISKTKRKCGIIERQNYNLAKGEDSKSLETPKDKEEAIIEAFKHFQMI
nr:zinc ribbon domain-containing protein [Lachnobacterium bovis]